MKYAKLQLALLARLYYGPAWLLVYICWEKGKKKIRDVHISFLVSGQRIPCASLAADYFGIITPLHERVSEASSLVCVCERVCARFLKINIFLLKSDACFTRGWGGGKYELCYCAENKLFRWECEDPEPSGWWMVVPIIHRYSRVCFFDLRWSLTIEHKYAAKQRWILQEINRANTNSQTPPAC